MIRYLLFVLLPLTAAAQFTFGPLRLDDGEEGTFYYPSVAADGEDTLRCMWSSISELWLSTMGQYIAPNGSALGNRMIYERVPEGGPYSCSAQISILPLSDGRTAQLVYHS